MAHGSRTHGHSHVRQQSQPGNVSASKQHWLQQQSPYSSGPVFYMNKLVFMEELSRKWSFCRLSEFFQCMDPASGISHRFKCKLLKENALKEERNQKPKDSSKAGPTLPKQQQQQQQQQQPQQQEPELEKSHEQPPIKSTEESTAREDMPLSPMDNSMPEVTINGVLDDAGDVVMADTQVEESRSTLASPSTTASAPQSTSIAQGTRTVLDGSKR
ncbi:hypothetical protein BGX31_010809 [Mortierella sp. GBA43]|nr:hypothetical protein BGX31_010809 [Mortierella sp. GBA43]